MKAAPQCQRHVAPVLRLALSSRRFFTKSVFIDFTARNAQASRTGSVSDLRIGLRIVGLYARAEKQRPVVYITSLHIENLRCFAEADLEMQYPGRKNKQELRLPNVNLLLGNNGSGKTTVLKAIAMSVLAPFIHSSGFHPYHLVRQPARDKVANINAQLIAHEHEIDKSQPRDKQLTYPMAGRITRTPNGDEIFNGFPGTTYEVVPPIHYEADGLQALPLSSFFIVGYGATRLVEDPVKFDQSVRRRNRSIRYERVAGLFENYFSLYPLANWLPQYKAKNLSRYKQVVDLINQLLPENARFLAKLEQGDYLFEINGTPAPFGALPDGYQAFIGWITDLLAHLCTSQPKDLKLVEVPGVVLVDEIDLHLHPDWQRSVVATIAEALPNLQFVFTTHSPNPDKPEPNRGNF
jgi:energy-coupling factor transporter ATP-binding protein EcfA2